LLGLVGMHHEHYFVVAHKAPHGCRRQTDHIEVVKLYGKELKRGGIL
jgi:hypothetical protein